MPLRIYSLTRCVSDDLQAVPGRCRHDPARSTCRSITWRRLKPVRGTHRSLADVFSPPPNHPAAGPPPSCRRLLAWRLADSVGTTSRHSGCHPRMPRRQRRPASHHTRHPVDCIVHRKCPSTSVTSCRWQSSTYSFRLLTGDDSVVRCQSHLDSQIESGVVQQQPASQ